MTIDIQAPVVYGYVREVSVQGGALDATYSAPEVAGSSQVLDEYCAVLEDVLRVVRRYKQLIEQDTTMVYSLLSEIAAADKRMSQVVASISGGSGSMRGV